MNQSIDNIGDEVYSLLWGDFDEESEFPDKTPLLAHYTSTHTFECIVNREEFWFSNPLNMNDSDELIFGVKQGAAELRNNDALIKACENKNVFNRLIEIFHHHLDNFAKKHMLDTYILCFSEHNKDDFDGTLSMWRGYRSNGSGICVVIDTKKIEPIEDSPIIIAAVKYQTNAERLKWIKLKVNQIAEFIAKTDKSDQTLNTIAWHWFERLKNFSLLTKHQGFQEEKEWRAIYLSDRDVEDQFSSLTSSPV